MTVDGEKSSFTITTISLQLRSPGTDRVFTQYRITNRSTPSSVTTLPMLCDRMVIRRSGSESQMPMRLSTGFCTLQFCKVVVLIKKIV